MSSGAQDHTLTGRNDLSPEEGQDGDKRKCFQGLKGKTAGYRNNLAEAAICLYRNAGVRLHKGGGRNADFSSLWKVFICLLFFFFFSFFKKKKDKQ